MKRMYVIQCKVCGGWFYVHFADGLYPRYYNSFSFSSSARMTFLRAIYLMCFLWWRQYRHKGYLQYRIQHTPYKWFENIQPTA